jgi:O-methyltransferase involved in polyketide biosynthesis
MQTVCDNVRGVSFAILSCSQIEPRRTRLPVRLRDVAATLLGPLYARALDTRRVLPILGDRRSSEIVDRLDYDFSYFERKPRVRSVVRTLVFDDLARRFLRLHPDATVVEIGAGLNARFERVDNERVRWFDLDLPEVTSLRRALLPSSPRRHEIAASFVEPSWMDVVARARAPFLFLFEAVLGYVRGPQIRTTLQTIAQRFPGATVAFDLSPRWTFAAGEIVTTGTSRLFSPDIPRAVEAWCIGLRLEETASFFGWSPRRVGAVTLQMFSPGVGAPCRVAVFRASEA